jgi:hypothetical protein
MKKTIIVKGSKIAVYRREQDDYISLTDIARYRDAERTDYIIQNWLRNRNAIEFLGIWEQLNNPDFKPVEFDGFKKQAGLNSFVLTAKRWIEQTGAIELVSKAGRGMRRSREGVEARNKGKTKLIGVVSQPWGGQIPVTH